MEEYLKLFTSNTSGTQIQIAIVPHVPFLFTM